MCIYIYIYIYTHISQGGFAMPAQTGPAASSLRLPIKSMYITCIYIYIYVYIII